MARTSVRFSSTTRPGRNPSAARTAASAALPGATSTVIPVRPGGAGRLGQVGAQRPADAPAGGAPGRRRCGACSRPARPPASTRTRSRRPCRRRRAPAACSIRSGGALKRSMSTRAGVGHRPLAGHPLRPGRVVDAVVRRQVRRRQVAGPREGLDRHVHAGSLAGTRRREAIALPSRPMERTLFDDEHELFRDSVRAFIAKELVPAPRGVGGGRHRRPRPVHQGRRPGLPRHGRARGARRRRGRATSATTS